MSDLKIQKTWQCSFDSFLSSGHSVSDIQKKVSHAVMRCKSGALGANACQCTECGHTEFHNNSCRNRNCPNCQAVLKEIWVDKRREEVIDAPYFHVVFTLPHELNPLIYCNQKLLYGLFHRCCAETLLELSYDKKYLGATPGIIQVLHTWNQEIGYHVHMHCIVSGGGLTYDKKIRRSKNKFFIPVGVLRDKFKGKYLSQLDSMYRKGQIVLSSSCEKLRNSYEWKEFKNNLYGKGWCPYIKETFNGFGNALEYLGRYTHKIAISRHGKGRHILRQGKKARRVQAPDHSGAYRIHSEIPDACASIRFSEDPLLWFPEQPDEEKKSETHFYSAGTPAF